MLSEFERFLSFSNLMTDVFSMGLRFGVRVIKEEIFSIGNSKFEAALETVELGLEN